VKTRKFVLYADDDQDDKAWIDEACKAARSQLLWKFVNNGKEVLNYLSEAQQNELPSLIVLDLNMPELDGKQTLRILKTDPSYLEIPVAVVTTSSSKLDHDVCKKLGASVFLTKPDSYSEWQDVIRQLEPLCET
jgi:two-component system response regulator